MFPTLVEAFGDGGSRECKKCGGSSLMPVTENPAFDSVGRGPFAQIRQTHRCGDCGHEQLMIPAGRDERRPRAR